MHIGLKIGMVSSLSKRVSSKRHNSGTLSNTSRNKAALTSCLQQSNLQLLCVGDSGFHEVNLRLHVSYQQCWTARGQMTSFYFLLLLQAKEIKKLNGSTHCLYFKGFFLFSRLGRDIEIFQLKTDFSKVFLDLHTFQFYSFQTVPGSLFALQISHIFRILSQ